MRAAWVRPGGAAIPDGAKAQRYGIDTLYYDATDPYLAGTNGSQFFDKLRSFGLKPGITRDPSWTQASPGALATTLDDDLKRLGSDNKTCYVIVDIERHDPTYVSTFLDAWRVLRPTRMTSWTLEPYQGGWFTQSLTQRINLDPNLTVLPQLYYGDMSPTVESQTAMNVEAAGVRWDRIKCYYDAARLPAAWDGVAFDFARLP